jgi:hypothetical protein
MPVSWVTNGLRGYGLVTDGIIAFAAPLVTKPLSLNPYGTVAGGSPAGSLDLNPYGTVSGSKVGTLSLDPTRTITGSPS